jgi:hypothetical protein
MNDVTAVHRISYMAIEPRHGRGCAARHLPHTHNTMKAVPLKRKTIADKHANFNTPFKRKCTGNNHKDAMPPSLIDSSRAPTPSKKAIRASKRSRPSETHLNLPLHQSNTKKNLVTPGTDPPPSFIIRMRPPSKRLKRSPAHLTTDYILFKRVPSVFAYNKKAEGTKLLNKCCLRRKGLPSLTLGLTI